MTSAPTPVDVDVLVVGLGPVGAALANLLGRFGVKVLVIDRETSIFAKPRAIALDNEALRILQMVGLEDDAFEKVAIPEVVYHSRLFGRFGRVNTGGVIDGHPMLVTFYQPELEQVLRARLARHPSVQVMLGAELAEFTEDGEGIRARLTTVEGRVFVVNARYLVGADGANSRVRQSLGLEFTGRSFQQDWLIVDAKRVPNPIDHCEFLCDPARPTPHMVAPGGRQRWEFMLHPGERPEDVLHPDVLRRLLSPWCSMEEIDVERTAVYRFQARTARAFSKGRCFLVGDAAHVTPPFAGQGLVAGLRDVANLSWKLAAVLRGQARAELLDSYDQERRPHARRIINLALFLGATVMPRNRLAAFCLHGLIRAARLLPAGRRFFDELRIKPANAFDKGFFWRGDGPARLGPGTMLPQAWVRVGASSEPVLSDDALGAAWSLIVFGANPEVVVPHELALRWQAIGGRVWQWCQRRQAQHLGAEPNRLESLDETLLPRRVPMGWAALVRPDGCVLTEGPAAQVGAMVQRALAAIEPAAEAAAGTGHLASAGASHAV